MAYSRYKLGEDGKTPYERQKGRKCVLEVVPFGELVRYKKFGRDIARVEISGEACGWGTQGVRVRRL